MSRLRPFFPYYGAKFRLATRYPAPRYGRVVEPFAGSAQYATLHHTRQVILIDANPVIAEVWRYLISADARRVRALPDVNADQTLDDFDLSPGERSLIGFWLNRASVGPRRSPSLWMRQYPDKFWSARVRERIATQLPAIRHWSIIEAHYGEYFGRATYFVDPPYKGAAGSHYPYGSRGLDYAALATWCRSLPGQVIVCENADATWLPFRPLATQQRSAAPTASRKVEGVWLSDEP